MHHKSKLPNLETTIFTVMSRLAAKHNALNLSQGFPDFKSDQTLIDLVSKAMNEGHNQYAPMPGRMDLREAISEKIDFLYQSTYHPESEITITCGASEAIYSIIATFVHPKDEVIIFKPAFDSYQPNIELHGGKTIAIQLYAPDYKIDWTEVRNCMTKRTKMIIINSPHNPSGMIFSEDDMLQLQTLTKGTDIIVLSDEVYEHIIFDGEKHQSVSMFPDLKSRSFVVASFGKSFHNTGWRIGYCCAPKELMEEFRKVHQFNVFSINNPTQKALADYLKERDTYLDLPGFYQEKRDLFLDLIKDSKFKFRPSKGTYFQLLEYSDITSEHDVDLAKRLTIEKGLASIPLSVFNTNNMDNKVLRFCFAKTEDTLKRAAQVLHNI